MSSANIKNFNGGRLLSIDALRGIAALSVVLYHAIQQTHKPIPASVLKLPALAIQFLSSFGYVGVFLFFVISGFCIHLQWAKSRSVGGSSEIEFGAFWKRRIRRLYPPYLIALAFFLIVAAITTGLKISWAFCYDLGMHLLMLHNLDPRTVYSINGVFWTLAVEEQLYLAYFLLLFLRQRWGWGVTLAVCFLSRVGWYFLTHFIFANTGFAVPVAEGAAVHWFTWALGAMSVEAFYGQLRLPNWSRSIWVGCVLVAMGAGMALVLPSLHNLAVHDLCWLFLHPVWGLGFFVIVNSAVFAEQRWLSQVQTPSLVIALAKVGVISYSLYLTHELVIMQSWRFGAWGWFPMVNTLLLVVPATVGVAWLFFRKCERPYMRKMPQERTTDLRRPDEVFTTVIQPAPATE